DRARRPQYPRLHAFAARGALYVRAGKRDGRTCRAAEDRPDRVTPDQRRHEGADRRQALYLALADGLLRRRCPSVWMGEAQSGAEIDDGGRLADRLRLRHHLLSDTDGAGGGPPAPSTRP